MEKYISSDWKALNNPTNARNAGTFKAQVTAISKQIADNLQAGGKKKKAAAKKKPVATKAKKQPGKKAKTGKK